MNHPAIIRRAWELFEPEMLEQGYELVEVELAGGSGNRVLRLFIDKPEGGITHEDCVAVTQLVSVLLDAEDLIEDEYMLEVSSPGIDRPMRKARDFERFAGEAVRLTTNEAMEGRKRFAGVLKGYQDGLIALECDGRVYEIHIENLRKANLNR